MKIFFLHFSYWLTFRHHFSYYFIFCFIFIDFRETEEGGGKGKIEKEEGETSICYSTHFCISDGPLPVP